MDYKNLVKGLSMIIFYFFINYVITYTLPIFFHINPNNLSHIAKYFFLIGSDIIIFLYFFFIFKRRIFKDFKNFKKNLKKNLKKCLKYWFWGLLVMFITNTIINFFIMPGNIAENENINRLMLARYPIYMIIAASITGPFIEELVFRFSFKNTFKKVIPFVIFTSLLFASSHVLQSKKLIELLYLIPYGALGASFGYIFYKYDNIWYSILIHMIHNTLTIAIISLSL